MKKRILHGFLIAMLLSLFFILPSSANHYLYLAEDWGFQNPEHQRNRVNFWWWDGLNTKWWVDPAAGSQFATDVEAAIDNWQNAFKEGTIQRLPWQKQRPRLRPTLSSSYLQHPVFVLIQ